MVQIMIVKRVVYRVVTLRRVTMSVCGRESVVGEDACEVKYGLLLFGVITRHLPNVTRLISDETKP